MNNETIKFDDLKVGMTLTDNRVENVVYEVQEIKKDSVELLGNDRSKRSVSRKAFDNFYFFDQVN